MNAGTETVRSISSPQHQRKRQKKKKKKKKKKQSSSHKMNRWQAELATFCQNGGNSVTQTSLNYLKSTLLLKIKHKRVKHYITINKKYQMVSQFRDSICYATRISSIEEYIFAMVRKKHSHLYSFVQSI